MSSLEQSRHMHRAVAQFTLGYSERCICGATRARLADPWILPRPPRAMKPRMSVSGVFGSSRRTGLFFVVGCALGSVAAHLATLAVMGWHA